MLINTQPSNAKRCNELREELYEGIHRGVMIAHNGELVAEDQLESILILMEENDYMREYTADKNGKIVKVNYERITQY